MAGYVGRMVEKQLLCDECSSSLGSTSATPQSKFVALKDQGGLFKPSPSVIKICEETEKCIQRLLTVTCGNLPQTKGVPDAIAVSVLGSVNLSELDDHMVDSPVDENYVFTLIKCIFKSYRKIRFHHLGKETTASL